MTDHTIDHLAHAVRVACRKAERTPTPKNIQAVAECRELYIAAKDKSRAWSA